MNLDRIIPITDLRRNFGEITANLASIDSLILTKGGKPYAILKAAPTIKKKHMHKYFGVWKDTELGDDKLWAEALKKKSRSHPIKL